MRYLIILPCCLFLLLSSFGLSQAVYAQEEDRSDRLSEACGGEGRYLLGVVPSWDRGLGTCEDLELAEILEGNAVKLIILNILAIIVALGSLLAVAFVIVGGFLYILSSGNPEQAANARKTIINALIGLLITIMGQMIAQIIYNQLTSV